VVDLLFLLRIQTPTITLRAAKMIIVNMFLYLI